LIDIWTLSNTWTHWLDFNFGQINSYFFDCS